MTFSLPDLSRLRYPQIADRLVLAWSPSIAWATGGFVYNCGGSAGANAVGAFSNMEEGDWQSLAGVPCVTVDGVNERVVTSHPSVAAIMGGATKASISAWIKGSNRGAVGFVNDAANTYRFTLAGDGSNWYFLCENGSNAYGFLAYASTAWNHFVMAFDGTKSTDATKLVAYINGDQKALSLVTIPTSLASVANIGQFNIGSDRFNAVRYWAASHADTLLYNRVLTQDDARLLYRLGPSGGWAERRPRRYSSFAASQPAAKPWLYAARKAHIIGGGTK